MTNTEIPTHPSRPRGIATIRRAAAAAAAFSLAVAGGVVAMGEIGAPAVAAEVISVKWDDSQSNGPFYYTVPEGTTSAYIEIVGGAGGRSRISYLSAGGGARIKMTTTALESGDVLEIWTGTAGDTSNGSGGASGGAGWSHGGDGGNGSMDADGGGGGGGSSAVLVNGEVMAVAAGGGGLGGSAAAKHFNPGTGSYNEPFGGSGGNPGNAGGNGWPHDEGGSGATHFVNGSNGESGKRATLASNSGGGGGGGAGYTQAGGGGGGGGWRLFGAEGGGGGAGGHSYVNPAYGTATQDQVQPPGYVSISFTVSVGTSVGLVAPDPYAAAQVGDVVEFAAVVSAVDSTVPAGEVCFEFVSGDECVSASDPDDPSRFSVSHVVSLADVGTQLVGVRFTPSATRYEPSAGSGLAWTVWHVASSVQVSAPTEAYVGESITLGADVSVERGLGVDGSATFVVEDDGVAVVEEVAPVNPVTGHAEFVLAEGLPAGEYQVYAEYEHSSPGVTPAVSSRLSLAVVKHAVSLGASVSPAPSVYGDPVDVRVQAVCDDGLGVVSGLVRVVYGPQDSPVVLAEGELVDGVALFPGVANWPWGDVPVTAEYSGNEAHESASTAIAHSVGPVSAGITINSAPESSFVGEQVTFSVSVGLSGALASGNLDGVLEVQHGDGTPVVSQPVSGPSDGAVELSGVVGDAGAHGLQVVYLDNRDYILNPDPVLTSHTVLKHEVAVDLGAAVTVPFGADIRFPINVIPSTGTHVPSAPSGEVTLSISRLGADTGEEVCAVDAKAFTRFINGESFIGVNAADCELLPGDYEVQAEYSGDDVHEVGVAYTRLTVAPSRSSLSLNVEPVALKAGQPIDMVATLEIDGPGTATGEIDFLVDGVIVDTVAVRTSGQTRSVSPTPIEFRIEDGIGYTGEQIALAAQYRDTGGLVSDATSTEVTISVGSISTAVELKGKTSSQTGDEVTFEAKVKNTEDSALSPSGQIQLFAYPAGGQSAAATKLGEPVVLNDAGQAKIDVRNLTAGKYMIYAEYLGSDVHQTSISQTIAHQVTTPVNPKPTTPDNKKDASLAASGGIAAPLTALGVLLIASGLLVALRRNRDAL